MCVCVCVNNDFATTTVSVSSGGVGRERDGFKVKEEETRKKNALNFLKVKRFSEEQLTDFLLQSFSSSVKTEEPLAAGEREKK